MATTQNIFIQILDDNPFYSKFLEHQIRQYLQQNFPDYEDVFVVASYTEVDDFLMSLKPENCIVLIDYYLENGVKGLELLPEIKKLSPEAKVIVMTTENNHEALVESLDTSIAGFVFKDEETVKLCQPIFEKEFNRLLGNH